jgi:uncharacterized protein YneF (UPF0154 family)
MSKQNLYPQLRSLFDKNREVVKMLKAERQLNENQICFRAVYFKLGRKIAETKDNPTMSSFTSVINGRYQVCEPDSISIMWHNAASEEKLFEHTFPISVSRAVPKLTEEEGQGLQGFQGLGAAEVSLLVEKRITELRSKEDHEKLKEDNQRLNQKLSELVAKNEELEQDKAAKETTENYMRIIGMALPGISKFFGGASVLQMLAGTEEEAAPKSLASASKPKDEREEMIALLQDYMQTDLNEQEVATLYLLFMEIQKDKKHIQQMLQLITQPTYATTPQA